MTTLENVRLHSIGLSASTSLREYQLAGVNWLKGCHDEGHGGLLCDEMGLGKTCQAISYLLSIANSERKMSLVLCPLTVLDNWKNEIKRFAPGMTVTVYVGDPDERSKLRKRVRRSAPDVLLATYDLCLRDNFFFEKRLFNTVIIDEGHRLKNSESLLYKAMEVFDTLSFVILSGTPVQNNLSELYALLSFVCPDIFKLSDKEEFLTSYKTVRTDEKVAEKLQQLIKPYLLRRTKAMVALDIPEKTEVTIYHPISDLQKKYYKAILTKDADAFETENTTSRTRLLNLLMQLRKCVNHPYLFEGVEPEPFQLGEHLVEASAKLVTLDKILSSLFDNGHKVLLFSQMTRMLDILQDYLHYRGYSYERLDGSVRGEERFTAIRNFNSTDDTFIFLLSSRAGGQGLNLVAADTVIFYDHDFNPQIDLQASARAHRIGQTRPVKIIRMVSKATVEEVILARAAEKLRLTQTVIAKGPDQDEDSDVSKHTARDLQKMLKHGLKSLLDPQTEDEDLNIEELLGSSENSKWVTEQSDKCKGDTNSTSDSQQPENIYQFEGKDYTKEAKSNKDDDDALQILLDEIKSQKKADPGSRPARNRRNNGEASLSSLSLPDPRTRKPLTAEQLEVRRKQREKTLERKKTEAAEREKRKEEKRKERWRVAGYTSRSVSLPSDSDETEGAEANSDSDDNEEVEYMHFVSGDVTDPVKSKAIIVQCVDDSGQWGRGGVFTALTNKTSKPEAYYELSGDMRDLHEGDVHVVDCDDVTSHAEYHVALLMAQDRNLKVKQSLLSACLKKLAKASKSLGDISVHLPRIGYNTQGFDWYSTERQLRKYLCNRKIHTYVYYYKRAAKRKTPSPTSSLPRTASDNSEEDSPQPKSARRESPSPSSSKPSPVTQPLNSMSTISVAVRSDGPLDDIFTDIDFAISSSVPRTERRRLMRYIIAFDGNVVSSEDENTKYTVTIEPSSDCVSSIPVQPEYVWDSICYRYIRDPCDYLVN